jgi:tRNA 2-thiouridine synthesizing protein A
MSGNGCMAMTDSDGPAADRTLDVRGTLCPVPVLRARQVLQGLRSGETLEVLATDPLAEMDLAVMCQHLGHTLLSASLAEGVVRVRIRRA